MDIFKRSLKKTSIPLIGYKVYHNSEQVGVDFMHYGCIAKLSRISTEYYQVKDDDSVELIESVLNTSFHSTFIEFKKKCFKYYDIIIDDKHCPKWSKIY